MEQMEDECRLCCSKQNLISLFHGKSKKKRDILRKLIYETVKTNIDPNDNLPKTICLDCCIDVFNFYNFKEECSQNEKALKEAEKATYKPKRIKVEHINILGYKLPSHEEVQESLSNWLTKKQNEVQCNDEKSLQLNLSSLSKSCQTDSVLTVQHQSCQTNTISLVDKSIQSYIKDKSVPKYTQTSPINIKKIGTQTTEKCCVEQSRNVGEKFVKLLDCTYTEVGTQTDTLYLDHKVSQTSILKKTSRKSTQTTQLSIEQVHSNSIVNGIEKHNINNDLSKKNNSIHNNLEKTIQHDLIQSICNVTVAKSTQTNSFVKTSRRHTQTEQENTPSTLNNIVGTLHTKSTKDIVCQTDVVRIVNIEEYSPKSTQTSKIRVVDKELQTDIVCACSEGVQCDLITDNISPKFSIKMDFKEELPSPSNFLHISTDTSFDSMVVKSPKTPTMSDLLKIDSRGKDHFVKMCNYCDKIFYNQTEQRLHKKNHMQCSLCKKRFRSVKSTNEHMEKCKFTVVATKIPYVSVVKVDRDTENGFNGLYKKAFAALEQHTLPET